MSLGERRHAPLPAEGYSPGFDGATGWLNTQPLTAEGLQGKVVLVDFSTSHAFTAHGEDMLHRSERIFDVLRAQWETALGPESSIGASRSYASSRRATDPLGAKRSGRNRFAHADASHGKEGFDA
jgi:hypothetical protein